MKKYALISVYDKRNLETIVPVLDSLGYTVISTAGTGKILSQMNIKFLSADKATQNPNAFTDCIQTISYSVSAGILFDRKNKHHIEQIKEFQIKPIDIVICNFPPIEQVVKDEKEFNITRVDVGGPLMIRSAATNYKYAIPVVNPDNYIEIAKKLKQGLLNNFDRKKLALQAFKYCSDYDNSLVKKINSFS